MVEKENYPAIILVMAAIFIVIVSVTSPTMANEYINSNAPDNSATVPDTGQRNCYDTHKRIPCPKPGEPFYGQDGNYSINAQQYELINQEGNEILTDHTSGLSWQRIPDTEQRTWSEAIDYANDLQFSGYTDWRLPEKQELQSILTYGNTQQPLSLPRINQKVGEAKKDNICAWTLTTRIFPSLYAKVICLGDNQGGISDKYQDNYVYAVRGPSLTYGKYQDNGNGTVTDLMTGLMWQAMEVRSEKWEQALAYCNRMDLGGYTDWRLPTIKELSTLVDESRINPSINTTFFPATRSAAYWSSTTFARHPGFAWYVRFDSGLEHNGGYKGRRYLIRAVRGGKIASAHPELPPFLQPTDQEKAEPFRPTKEVPDTDSMDMLEPYPLIQDTL